MNNITYFAVCITIANWWFSSLWQIFFQSSGQNSYFQLQLHGYLSHHLSLQGLPDLSLRINELNSPAKIKYKRWPMTPALIDLERVFHTPTGNLWKKMKFQRYYPVPIHQLSTDLFTKLIAKGRSSECGQSTGWGPQPSNVQERKGLRSSALSQNPADHGRYRTVSPSAVWPQVSFWLPRPLPPNLPHRSVAGISVWSAQRQAAFHILHFRHRFSSHPIVQDLKSRPNAQLRPFPSVPHCHGELKAPISPYPPRNFLRDFQQQPSQAFVWSASLSGFLRHDDMYSNSVGHWWHSWQSTLDVELEKVQRHGPDHQALHDVIRAAQSHQYWRPHQQPHHPLGERPSANLSQVASIDPHWLTGVPLSCRRLSPTTKTHGHWTAALTTWDSVLLPQ